MLTSCIKHSLFHCSVFLCLMFNKNYCFYRSLPYSTNYTQPRQESAAARASIRRKPLSSTNSSYMVSRTTNGSRSNSCLTSQQVKNIFLKKCKHLACNPPFLSKIDPIVHILRRATNYRAKCFLILKL